MIDGALITAVLFGEMAVIMDSIGKKSNAFKAVLDTSNTAMKNMKLPEELQLDIYDYLVRTRNTYDA